MKDKETFKSVMRNITPAIAVMVAGLGGAFLVYDNYFSDKVSSGFVRHIEPAAGEDMMDHASAMTSEESADEGMVEAGEEMMEDAGEATEEVVEDAGEMMEDAGEATEEAVEDAGDMMEDAGEEMTDDADHEEHMDDAHGDH